MWGSWGGCLVWRPAGAESPARLVRYRHPGRSCHGHPQTPSRPRLRAKRRRCRKLRRRRRAKNADLKPALPTAKGETKTTAGGVKYETVKEGTGAELKIGQNGAHSLCGQPREWRGIRQQPREQPAQKLPHRRRSLDHGLGRGDPRDESRRDPQAHDPVSAGIRRCGTTAQDPAESNAPF